MLSVKLIVFLPLIGALLAVPTGLALGQRAAEVLTTTLLLIAAVLSVTVFFDVALSGEATSTTVTLMRWIESGSLSVSWALKIDTLSAVMLVVVTGVSSLVHLYSIGYMHEDPHRPRFFAYLSLFTFAMLMLVTADNFLQLFFGWEGVGLASYLLIGFWFDKASANGAAMKAFIVNRVGDFGFALGIMAIFMVFGSLSFEEVFAAAPGKAADTFVFLGQEFHMLTVVCLLLFMGAMGKSAQFLLHTWLPDAMEGPTPVSALIHAATMVTAGVFLVCRCSPLFELAPIALGVVTVIGAVTAIFAATVAVVQNDIKRVIAYSTCSQLGYMFFAAGVSAYQVAMFHLFTHAFFKALLFLGAGSVIHALHHEQDMRKMGGTYKYLPITWLLMLVGTFALIGFGIPGIEGLPRIGFAGFYSKDAALEAAYWSHTLAGAVPGAAADLPWYKDAGRLAFWLGIAAALLTSFYSWRLIFMTFHGRPRMTNEVLSHAHEAPQVMLVPLLVLAIGAVGAGIAFEPYFIGKKAESFWGESITILPQNDVMHYAHRLHDAVLHPEPHGATDQGAAATAGDISQTGPDAHGAPAAPAEHGAAAAAHGASAAHGAGDAHGAGGEEIPLATVSKLTWSLVTAAAVIVTLIGFALAWLFYVSKPEWPRALAARQGPLYRFLDHKWYFDELYDAVFVKGAQRLGRTFWRGIDMGVIDRFGPNGFAASVVAATKRIIRLQTGYIYHYAFAMLIGIALIVTFYLARGGL